jgi:ABC-type multidrug transport system ATPase subunit
MKKEKHKCQGKKPCRTISDALLRRCYPQSFDCYSNASVEENGKWYCKIHAPSKILEREKKSEETERARFRRADEKYRKYNPE